MSVHTHGIDEVSFDINTEPLVFTSEPTPGLDDHDLADVQLAPLRNSLTSSKSCLNSPEQPFPSLPVEIIIQILDLTASLSRRSASSISSVSTWARELALPYLFSTIIHRATPSIFAGITSVNSLLQYRSSQAKTPEKCGRYVRNLWIESIGIGTPSSEVDTLRSCPNVENLALPSASLRVLYTAIQIAAAEKYQPSQPQTQFLDRLYSITLITHTFRYDWHFLIGVYLSNGKPLLDAITRLRILDMKISGYVPYLLLPNLTHLAIPYLDLGNNFEQDTLRLPDGILAHASLEMIVLSVDEERWLTNPWYRIERYQAAPSDMTSHGSPRETFCKLVQWAQQKDQRIFVILSPRMGQNLCSEWETDAREGSDVWSKAAKERLDGTYGADLPEVYPKGLRR